MGMSQMCTGAGDYFRTSKPHSEKLCIVCPKTSTCTQKKAGRMKRTKTMMRRVTRWRLTSPRSLVTTAGAQRWWRCWRAPRSSWPTPGTPGGSAAAWNQQPVSSTVCRCVVCRDGQAVEMSFDHKPEDDIEMKRIKNAGGKVTPDGRVNGGLNLSRAIGDHAYKQNKSLSLPEQMISPQPDIRTLEIDPERDSWMILACDGIWNFMSSQEVVDYVHQKIDSTPQDKLSSICEEVKHSDDWD